MTSTSGSGASISSLVQPAQKGKNVRDVERCGDNIECARCRHTYPHIHNIHTYIIHT